MPCGAGKTRISLRIVEELTPKGQTALVLCPSIALVAQIRREYLHNATSILRTLAVCSDQTAGYDVKKEDQRDTVAHPTHDVGNVDAASIKGKVTTDPQVIADWIQEGQTKNRLNVIFGTYQSGHRIAEALRITGSTLSVIIADEAHRTAGIRLKKKAKNGKPDPQEQALRDFTLCHNNEAFPATYRVYQTATPRTYTLQKTRKEIPEDYIVRDMDNETTFGTVLYRKTYVDAVNNGWLADYRIIAVAINDKDIYDTANTLARETASKGRRRLTTADYLRGITLAITLAGGAADADKNPLPIKSCIGFMNTVDGSKNMAKDLAEPPVRNLLQRYFAQNLPDHQPSDYNIEHLDASDSVSNRDAAKANLASATEQTPHCIMNVGIFGEGTDSPSLSAVAFLNPRRSPFDVIQITGRAMRAAPEKQYGYIICPVVIPPDKDPETYLSVSNPDEGWQELGQLLLALRAHDARIEDQLETLIYFSFPEPPAEPTTPEPVVKPDTVSLIAAANPQTQKIDYFIHQGKPGQAELTAPQLLDKPAQQIPNLTPFKSTLVPPDHEPSQVITVKYTQDQNLEMRRDNVVRESGLDAYGNLGPVNFQKTQAHAKAMINNEKGQPVPPKPEPKPRPTAAERLQTTMKAMEGPSQAIKMNLLSKSGLAQNRIDRDLNILRNSIKEATHHLTQDELGPILDSHFGLDHLKEASKKQGADGCTIAALLIMNAAMLHQRIANGAWLTGITSMSQMKNNNSVVQDLCREWERIMRHDFRPIFEPALEAIYKIEQSGKVAGLERALRHIASEAERIAETYADMGTDHAGPLFNQVMGNQASDGAFFTRPPAAALAAGLTLDAADPNNTADWTNPNLWKDHKAVDLACGSGTLLAALLAEMKRRAQAQGALPLQLAQLQKTAVEETLKGLDINPISLQLAAAQLTAGNQDIRYKQMGLHLMPYGPQTHNPGRVAAGTLELLGQSAIVPRHGTMNVGDDKIQSQTVWPQGDNAELDDAVVAVKDARIVIMNPPFTERTKMGQKFPKETQQALRRRADDLEQAMVKADQEMLDFVSKRAIRSLFVALADKCAWQEDSILTMLNPTIALTAPSGIEERRLLAQRWHIHTILTCHQPGNVNLSQHTGVNESIIVAKRHNGPKPPTRFINLDRLPFDDAEVEELHRCLADCPQGTLADGWGEVSQWPAERIAAGDWTPAIWRSPELAEAAARFANDSAMQTMQVAGLSPQLIGPDLTVNYEQATAQTPGSFPVLKSKGADGQTHIQSQPDEYWIPKNRDESIRQANGGSYPAADKILAKAGHFLITDGQNNSTARLTAVAADAKFIGGNWMPITGLSAIEAKALAIFINSTPGRLQLMRNSGRTLIYPLYRPSGIGNIRIPNIKDARVCQTLADCWEATKNMVVPQFRDGECVVRQLWDEAVAQAMGWDPQELTHLRLLLHQEPHVRGLGYGQYANDIEDDQPEPEPEQDADEVEQ